MAHLSPLTMLIQRYLLRSTAASTKFLHNNFFRFSSTTPSTSTSSAGKYPIPPRLPYIDGFIRDSRGDRQLRSIFNFETKNGETKQLRIEIADEKDIPLVVQSCADLFINDVNIYKHLNSTYDDLAQLYFDRKSRMLSSGVNFVIKDGDKVIGFTIGDVYGLKDVPEKYQKSTKHAKFEIKNDYAQVRVDLSYSIREETETFDFTWAKTDNSSFTLDFLDIKNAEGDNEKTRIINAFFESTRSQVYKFVPSDAKKFFLYEATGIHEDYRQSSLYPTLFQLMFESAKGKGAEYMITYCLATASARQARKTSNLLIKFPYDRFKQNGKAVFYDLCDGAEALKVYGKWL